MSTRTAAKPAGSRPPVGRAGPGKTATGKPGAAGPPRLHRPEQVRNVALIGHGGVGKTTLAEHLLVRAGVLGRPGSVAEGTTVSDSDPVEIAQQRSVFLAACPLRYGDLTITLLDTPGFADFVGELRAGLRAADGALFVVSAADPLDETTLALWEECAAAGTPRAVVITRLDAPRADLAATLQACREAFGAAGGNAVLPRYVPDGDRLVDLLTSTDAAHAGARGALIEAIIAESEDESLLEAYLEGAELDPGLLRADLHTAVSKGHFHPVVPVCADSELGLPELLDLIASGFPAPTERPLPQVSTPAGDPADPLLCDPSGPLAGEVVRSWVDPYLGRVALVRIFSGTVRTDTPLHVSGHGGEVRGHPDHDADERGATLLSTGLDPLDSASAGDLAVIARLGSAETGDTISAQDQPLLIEPWAMPEPLLPMAVRAATHNDEDALLKALARLEAADPSLRVDRNAETGQLVLWCLGEAHADVVLNRLRAGGSRIETEPVRVPLLATVTRSAIGRGRQVKQSGGHGQYGVCEIELEPLPRGTGIEFVDRVVGGAVPSQFISSVEKGARAQLAAGVPGASPATAGGHGEYPVVDVRVTLRDGKAHSVDSSDAAFQIAGALAVKDAAANAGVKLLEPVDAIDVVVADEQIGAVLSDLSGRRGRVTGTEPLVSTRPGSRTVIHAEVPAVELLRYPVTLRSMTGGAGSFSRRYLRHEAAPAPSG